ncbi:cation transporter [Pelovirga terrestris]|uniref:Cation transporter n=1 Tax=Pelovirga terrestris TaxID=2771352 RepID=A0A8J6UHP8_9BACT|nr:cation transporter [Pelovirga terrestris]MBD1399645.1 cation transporter [Pelovirga terrestris]
MKQKTTYLAALAVFTVLAVVAMGWTPRTIDAADVSLAVYNVEKMTCGACVRRVQNALAGVNGVGKVEVSVTTGRSNVEYDAARVDPATIAAAITAAGYPATLQESLSTDEYRALKAEDERLANRYVARVGERLLPREEFQAVLEKRMESIPQSPPPAMLNQLRQQVWNELLQRELLLNAAEQSQVVVYEDEVFAEIERIKADHADFDQLLAKRFGSLAAFSVQLKNDMIISKHLALNVSAPGLSAAQQQQQLQFWYQQLVRTTPLVIFDPELKAANSGSRSGCGGSCGG